LTGHRGPLLPFSVQIVPDRNSRYATHVNGLACCRKVLYRTLVIESHVTEGELDAGLDACERFRR
jgi:hypothetical protein